MNLTAADDDRIVMKLYEAAAGMSSWRDALGALHAAMKVDAIQLVVFDKSDGHMVTSEQPADLFSQRAVDAIFEHIREFHRFDPHIAKVAQLPIGRVFHSDRDAPLEQRDDHPFYREYWSAHGVRSVVAAKVGEDEEQLAILGLMRLFDRSAFHEAEIERFERLSAHCAAALRVSRHLALGASLSSATLALVDASNRATCVVTEDGYVIHANRRMESFLAANRLIVRDGSSIRFASAEATRAFGAALVQLSDGKPARPVAGNAARTALRLEGPGGPLLCTLWAVQPASGLARFGAGALVVLSVNGTFEGGDDDHQFLAAMYDLTPAEARLASALGRNVELHDVARSRGLSVETVRSQLRAVLHKTGTHRQSELIALVQRVLSPL